jgi:tripartite-type tricarboxylate transporter receptor subunit TctC
MKFRSTVKELIATARRQTPRLTYASSGIGSANHLRERYSNLGMDLAGGTPEEFGAHFKSELAKWARVVKMSGAKVH